MGYAKLSCTEFYPRYLQQCAQLTYSLIGPLAMARSWNWLFIFFRELNMMLGAQVVLCITEPDFLKKMFYSQNGENRPSPGFFECIEKFSFLSVWPIRKVYITVIPVCLKNFIFGKILVSEKWPKMLFANQIAGFFNQSQDSEIGCVSQRN